MTTGTAAVVFDPIPVRPGGSRLGIPGTTTGDFTALDFSASADPRNPGAPTPDAVRRAKELVGLSTLADLPPERVEPSAMGGVGVTFSAGSREVVVEFYNNGTAHALFSDAGSDDMRTKPVMAGPAGCREILAEIQSHLHAA